jgi:hypothetical protein
MSFVDNLFTVLFILRSFLQWHEKILAKFFHGRCGSGVKAVAGID